MASDARGGERQPEVGGRVRHLHAAAAATRGRLDEHGDSRWSLAIFIASGSLVTAPSEPGTTGMPSALCGFLRSDLVAHDADVLGRRPDEGDAVLLEDLGEAGVLGQEAVAGMHGVGAGDLAGSDKRGMLR